MYVAIVLWPWLWWMQRCTLSLSRQADSTHPAKNSLTTCCPWLCCQVPSQEIEEGSSLEGIMEREMSGAAQMERAFHQRRTRCWISY